PKVEAAAFPDAPYRTTIHLMQTGEVVLYEVQGALQFHDRLQHFAQWLAAARSNARLFIVGDGDAPTTAEFHRHVKRAGVGLQIRLQTGAFEELLPARNHAYTVVPNPML